MAELEHCDFCKARYAVGKPDLFDVVRYLKEILFLDADDDIQNEIRQEHLCTECSKNLEIRFAEVWLNRCPECGHDTLSHGIHFYACSSCAYSESREKPWHLV